MHSMRFMKDITPRACTCIHVKRDFHFVVMLLEDFESVYCSRLISTYRKPILAHHALLSKRLRYKTFNFIVTTAYILVELISDNNYNVTSCNLHTNVTP